ncbi:hypothetical protein [Kitasatospora sp. NPDC007106]|uniref:hypothetical protein n=1 Tax=Kitasatospora sp. NPDC007106 TaxID=3156914 RepID=UPI0033F1E8E4
MGREYHFHCEYAGCSVTAGVRLGGVRELEVLVNGHEVAFERVHGHHPEEHSLIAVLPTSPPRHVEVRIALPGVFTGIPSCALFAGEVQVPMAEREVPRRARPTEASWYG